MRNNNNIKINNNDNNKEILQFQVMVPCSVLFLNQDWFVCCKILLQNTLMYDSSQIMVDLITLEYISLKSLFLDQLELLRAN